MRGLTSNDLERISGTILSLYGERTADEFPGMVLRVLRSLLPCEHCSYNEVDLQSGGVRIMMYPELPLVHELNPAFQQHIADHPCFKYHVPASDPTIHKTTDYMSQRQFQQLGIFREFYRHVDTRVQMVFYFKDTTPNSEIGIAINRLKEFSERDRQVLACVRPHLAQALKNASAFSNMRSREIALEETLARLDRGLIQLTRNEQILWITPKAVRLLENYFPGSMKHPEQLPEALHIWLKQSQSQVQSFIPPQPFCTAKQHSRLCVVLQYKQDGGLFLLLSEQKDLAQSAVDHKLGLTARQIEVMHWITEGKSNPDIATILGLSVRTVHKHVEHVMSKLGVETRSAVSRRVLELKGVE